VRYVGCSNETAYGLTKSLGVAEAHGLVRYETIQNNFSLLHRRFEDELAEVCRSERVSLLAYSPLAGGVLSGKYQGGNWPAGARFSLYRDYNERTRAMSRRFVNDRTLSATERYAGIAREAGIPLATLAIAWVLSRDFVGAAIVGASRPEQLEATLGAAGLVLDTDVLQACDQVAREIPYPMG
jgi:aryl-alcohol dehydrogenase-like predicted oxidoreductase